MQPRTLPRQLVGLLAGAVGRVVIDDQALGAGACELGEKQRQHLALVVGRDDDDLGGHAQTLDGRRQPGLRASKRVQFASGARTRFRAQRRRALPGAMTAAAL
jgi:hypothetical protein